MPEILQRKIIQFIERSRFDDRDDPAFNTLALSLFRYQYQHNPFYRKLCRARKIVPESISRWQVIPAVMTTSFKDVPLFCGDPEKDAVQVFHTSGTTRQQPGKHYLKTCAIYQKAALRFFEYACLQGQKKMPMLILGPTASVFPNSSLGMMFSWILERFGTVDSTVMRGHSEAEYSRIVDWLQAEDKDGVFLLATSLELFNFIVWMQENRIILTPGSIDRILDTGGSKTAKTKLDRAELLAMIESVCAVPRSRVINEYGMTEMASQYYQSPFLPEKSGASLAGHHVRPPWLRTIACDPPTLQPLPEGEAGVLRHFDLANLDSVGMLQTEDIGIVCGNTLTLLGRDPASEPRGCSILAEECAAISRAEYVQ